MTKLKSILSDEEVHNLFALNNDVFHADSDGNFYTQDGGYCVDTVDLFEVGRKLEQAVLAKLAGQEPVAVVDYFDGTVGLKKQINTLPKAMRLYAHPMPSKPYSIDKDDAGIRKLVSEAITGAIHGGLEGGEAPPAGHWLNEFYEYGAAYENMQSRVHKNEVACMSQPTDKKACVSEIGGSESQNNGLSDGTPTDEGTKERQRATESCLELIAKGGKPRREGYGWDDEATPSNKIIIQLMAKYHLQMLVGADYEKVMDFGRDVFNYAVENHIADARKMVCSDHIADMRKKAPDGWQLTPTQATNDMYMGFCNVRSDIEPDEFREAYRAMLEAAPKYAGDSNE